MPVRIDEMSAEVQAEQQHEQTSQTHSEPQPGPLAKQDELRRTLCRLEQRRARIKAD